MALFSFFLLSNKEDKKTVCEGDRIIMKKKMFIVKLWNPKDSNICGSIKSIPLWVNFSNIPIFVWSPLSIDWLTSRIGQTKFMEENTEEHERISYAKVLIEVPPHYLVDSFPVRLPCGPDQLIQVYY